MAPLIAEMRRVIAIERCILTICMYVVVRRLPKKRERENKKRAECSVSGIFTEWIFVTLLRECNYARHWHYTSMVITSGLHYIVHEAGQPYSPYSVAIQCLEYLNTPIVSTWKGNFLLKKGKEEEEHSMLLR